MKFENFNFRISALLQYFITIQAFLWASAAWIHNHLPLTFCHTDVFFKDVSSKSGGMWFPENKSAESFLNFFFQCHCYLIQFPLIGVIATELPFLWTHFLLSEMNCAVMSMGPYIVGFPFLYSFSGFCILIWSVPF